MKIVYISTSDIPSITANSIQVMKMCQAFKNLGHDITLLTPGNELNDTGNNNDLWKHYGIRNKFRITYIGSINSMRVSYKYKIFIYLLFNRPKLLYTRDIYISILSSILRINTIIELHDPGYGPFRIIGYNLISYLKCILKVVLISEGLKDIVLKRYDNKRLNNKIIIAHDGVDIKRFENIHNKENIRKTININQHISVVGYCGHLYKGRGIELIMELSGKLADKSFLIIGGNNKEVKYYINKAKESNIKNIQFVGFVENMLLPQYLAACDILLMPYQDKVTVSGGGNTVEFMSPLKMFEYMASKRPIICSNLKVIREVLDDNSAILCNPNNIDEWVNGINKLIENRKYSKNIAQNAFNNVIKYEWEKRANHIIQDLL